MVVHYLSSTAIQYQRPLRMLTAILRGCESVDFGDFDTSAFSADLGQAWHRLSTLRPRWNKEATLPNHSKERDEAEARFKRAQKAIDDAKEAKAHYESEARAVREKTARLKALRLAKEAADLATQGDTKPITSKTTPSI
jgi:hypothetical protein